MDCVRRDMQELRITSEDAQDRTFWKSRIRAAEPTCWEKAKNKKIQLLYCCHLLCINSNITLLNVYNYILLYCQPNPIYREHTKLTCVPCITSLTVAGERVNIVHTSCSVHTRVGVTLINI